MYRTKNNTRSFFPNRSCGTCVACKTKECEWIYGFDDILERPDKVGYILKRSSLDEDLYTAVDLLGVLQRPDVLEHLSAFAETYNALVILLDGPTGQVFGFIGAEDRRQYFFDLLSAHVGEERASAVLGDEQVIDVPREEEVPCQTSITAP